MRILLINPNTTQAVTGLVSRVVASHLPDRAQLVSATGRFGAAYISSRSSGVIAAHAVLEAYAEHGAGCEGVYLACFGDPGLLALKELARIPVIGMAEGSCLFAKSLVGRFSIVTGGERWAPMLRELAATLGFAENLAAVETVAPTGAEIARDPDGAVTMLADACRLTVARDGAKAVVLGGAGLAGLAPRIQPFVDVPVICSTQAGISALLAAMESASPKPVSGDLALPAPVASTGLSPALERLLAAP